MTLLLVIVSSGVKSTMNSRGINWAVTSFWFVSPYHLWYLTSRVASYLPGGVPSLTSTRYLK